MQSSSMSHFFLKLSLNSRWANNFLSKYVSYINYFFEKEYKKAIYVETIADGFIVIWENFACFNQDFTPYPNEILVESKAFNSEMNLFSRIGIPRDKFPEEGLIISFEVHPNDFLTVKTRLTHFFRQFDPQIQFEYEKPKIKVIFTTYVIFHAYFNPVYLYLTSKYEFFRE